MIGDDEEYEDEFDVEPGIDDGDTELLDAADEELYDPVDEHDRVQGGRQTTKPKKLSLGLFLGSNPTKSKRYDEDEIGTQRRVLCRRYVNCLTWAAQEDWLGWHCGNCNVKDVISREQHTDDLEGLSDFLRELNLLDRKKR